MIDSCAPMPNPQIAAPIRAVQKPPRNTSGANEAESRVRPIRTENPNRSYKRPNNSDPLPLTAIATA